MAILPLTGWEPHRAVSWAARAHELGLGNLRCLVFGREPITSSEIWLDGHITEWRHERYDRGFTLTNAKGLNYKVGGTNTTSSIATNFLLLYLPDKLVGAAIPDEESPDAIDRAIRSTSDPDEFAAELNRVEYGVRLGITARQMRAKYLHDHDSQRHARSQLVAVESSAKSSVAAGVEGWRRYMDGVLNQCEGVVLQSDVAVHLAYIAALVPCESSARLLLKFCSDERQAVRRAAALSLRSLEDYLQEEAAASPALLSEVIDQTRALLGDLVPEIRVYAAESLGYFGNDEGTVLLDLVRLLSTDEDAHVRWACAVSLGRRARVHEVYEPLLEATRGDSYVRVRKSALLSLGRVLGKSRLDPVPLELSRLDLEQLETYLRERLADRDEGVAGYAAYALGELGDLVTGETVGALVESLVPELSFVVRCNALLALGKLLPRASLSDDDSGRLEDLMHANLFAEVSSEHPGSAYREWFLDQGWQLLTHLARPRLAALYARSASETFGDYPKRARYYEALAQCELAEADLSTMRLERSIDRLKSALAKFSELRQLPNRAGDLSERAISAAATRALLVRARLEFLDGLRRIRSGAASLSTGESPFVRAEELYRRVLDGRPGEPTAVELVGVDGMANTAQREYELVAAYVQLCQVSQYAERLRIAVVNLDEDAMLLRRLGLLDASIANFCREIEPREYVPAVRELSVGLRGLLLHTYESLVAAVKPITAIVGGVADEALRLVCCTLPIPDVDYRLLGSGRASFTMRIEGKIDGVGTETDPYRVRVDEAWSVRVVVGVVLRAENELLVLREIESPLQSRSEWPVPVHEGTAVHRIEYAGLPARDEPYALEFALEFLYRGIADIAQRRSLFIKVVPGSPNASAPLSERQRRSFT